MTLEVFRTTFRGVYPAFEQSVLLHKMERAAHFDGQLRCRVHAVKFFNVGPFRFCPNSLMTEHALNEARQDCPGMDSPTGRLYSLEEIERFWTKIVHNVKKSLLKGFGDYTSLVYASKASKFVAHASITSKI